MTGKVTLGGSPLADADIMFLLQDPYPAGYNGTAARSDTEGNFEVMTGTRKGAPAGKYKVAVSKWVGKDGKPVVANPATGMDLVQMKASGTARQAVPPEYSDIAQSKIEITVEDGKAVAPLIIEAK